MIKSIILTPKPLESTRPQQEFERTFK